VLVGLFSVERRVFYELMAKGDDWRRQR
jgi:hypothetical protein